MAFDNPTRNRLNTFVGRARQLITTEFTQKFQSLYGIALTGELTPLSELKHLDEAGLATAALLRARIDYLISSQPVERDGAKVAVERLAREQAFTVLNRLAAVRMAEKRELIVESVGHGFQSKGFQVFERVAGKDLGDTFQRYRRFLFCLFDELSVDLGVLFDRRSPQALLFPREPALLALFELINAPDLDALWAEDETIGWIYQYYNDQAERKTMREQSSAPRNSRELAVRNQFFTPRYVVEFLTDNTLGRIWHEMTQGETKLKEQCRYMVRRPTEIFLKPGENPPNQLSTLNSQPSTAPTQEGLLRAPVHIPHRPLKDPRTILMLDPACGSMHFGLYAFDLFEVIYDEAWALEEKLGADALSRPPGMKPLHATYAVKDAFLRQVPRLIIEHNLHGIDIDPRCAQIAGLSLWLRAQKAWQRLGLKPADRPAIKRSNIVCAEPMPGEKELLREFVEREFPAAERPVCLRLLEAIFDKMQLAGEAGSLLKIEEEIRSAIEDARDAWQKLATKPQELFTTTELNQLSTAPELTGLEQAVSSLTTDPRHLTTDFWERIEERIYAALRDYAEQAENGGGFQRRLFAEDAARGFAFIDVCRKRYDVALMNPPYGDTTNEARDYVETNYPLSKYDLYSVFVESFSERLVEGGMLGALTSRTGFLLSRLRDWRLKVANSDSRCLDVLADLGYGVLDGAMVQTAAYVIARRSGSNSTLFRNLRGYPVDQKDSALLAAITNDGNTYLRLCSDLAKIPGSPFAYWISDSELRSVLSSPSMGSLYGVKQGIATADNDRFLRLFWEVWPRGIGAESEWRFYNKGGESRCFYFHHHLLVRWDQDGKEIKANADLRYGSFSRTIKNEAWFLKPGMSFPLVSKYFCVRALPRGFVFDMHGPSIYAQGEDDLRFLLGFLNAKSVARYLGFFTDDRSWQVLYVQSIPVPQFELATKEKLGVLGISGFKAQLRIDQADETSVFFCITEEDYSALNLAGVSKFRVNRFEGLKKSTTNILLEIDRLVSDAFGNELPSESTDQEALDRSEPEDSEHPFFRADTDLSFFVGCVFGRWDIRYATGEQAAPELPDPFAPLPVCPPGQLQNPQGLPARPEDVPAAYPVRIPWDGILVDDPNHPLDIERRVREVIEIIWSGQEGGPTAEAIEHEACEILGVKSLRDYFRKPAGFFADHLKRYSKSRRQAPIYWPLSTASGSYTLWIYYHRLTDQTLHTVLADFLKPKIKSVEQEISGLRGQGKVGGQIGELQSFLDELLELREEIERVIKLPWKPNLNDGVLITAAPLWKLFRLGKWQKDLKACWDELEAGDYDWAHLAYTIWPTRVREKCKADRSLAIAHSLEDICEVKAPEKKAKKPKTTKTQMEIEEAE